MSYSKIMAQTQFTAPTIRRRPAETYPTAAPTTYDLFTVTGNILLLALSAVVTVLMPAGAKTIAVRANAVAMDNTAYDLVNNAVGTRIIVHGAVAVETIISAMAASSVTTATLPWVVCPGTIDFILSTNGTVAGALMWEIEYVPLTEDASVVVAV